MLAPLGNLADIYRAQGKIGETARLQEDVVDWQRIRDDDLETKLRSNLGSRHQEQVRMEKTARLEEEAVAKTERIGGISGERRGENSLAGGGCWRRCGGFWEKTILLLW